MGVGKISHCKWARENLFGTLGVMHLSLCKIPPLLMSKRKVVSNIWIDAL